MTRRPLAALLLLGACTVGSAPGGQAIIDANGGDDSGGQVDASNGCIKADTDPNTLHTHTNPAGGAGVNVSNAGLACLTCHSTGGTTDPGGLTAPVWQFAGTVYHSDGTTPYAGIHIKIAGSDAVEITAETDTGGNFYVDPGVGLTNPFPGHSFVTSCPAAPTAMAGALVATTAGGAPGGDCNGCHTPGGAAPKTGVLILAP